MQSVLVIKALVFLDCVLLDQTKIKACLINSLPFLENSTLETWWQQLIKTQLRFGFE